MHKLAKLAAMAAMLLAPVAAQAAAITWSTGPTFSGANGFQGILTNGTLIAAVNTGSTGVPLTVDPTGLNITFTSQDSPFLPNFFFGSGSPGSTDAAWNSIIDSNEWASADFLADDFLGGLTVGNSYQIQLFAADSRSCCAARTSGFGDGLGNFSANIVQGSFTSIVGLFTADAATQDIFFETSSNAPILNAYVLRQTAVAPPVIGVPEPMTLSLLGAGLAGVALARRKRV